MTRTLVHVVATEALTPDRVLSRLSLTLSGLIPPASFVTACYLILEPESGRFEYSLAGHDPPLVARAAERCVERLPAAGGPPLGAFPSMPFATARRLASGGPLVLHTDG
jgi:sigma-B regulation protein RsbU (phosphoserine phosphatase)